MSSLRDRKSSRIEDVAQFAELPAGGTGSFPEIVIGTIARLAADGTPEVDFPGNAASAPLPALSTAAVGTEHVGREAALVFVDGNPQRPVILGLIGRQAPKPASQRDAPSADASAPAPSPEARLDGERIVLTAGHEIELRCGKASLILTRAGKVLIRGAYLLSRSSGVNRIKGGSVQIN